jgi:hypothetical protein
MLNRRFIQHLDLPWRRLIPCLATQVAAGMAALLRRAT